MIYTNESGNSTAFALPTAGELLGELATAFQLKEVFHPAYDPPVSSKTTQRLFNGDEVKVSNENLQAIIEHMVSAYFKSYTHGFGPGWDRAVAEMLGSLYQRWRPSQLFLNDVRFASSSLANAYLPILRMATWSLALRLGAWRALRGRADTAKLVASRQPFAFAMDEFRTKPNGKKTSLEELTRWSGYTLEDFHRWRSGKHRPSTQSVHDIAATLAKHASQDETVVHQHLMTASGFAYLYAKVEEVIGKKRFSGLLEAMEEAANLVRETLESCFATDEDARYHTARAFQFGEKSEVGGHLCNVLANASKHEPVTDDFLALAGPWEPRLQYWAKRLSDDGELDGEFFAPYRRYGITEKEVLMVAKASHESLLAAANFTQTHTSALRNLNLSQRKLLAFVEVEEVYALIDKAEQHDSIGALEEAVQILHHTVMRFPQNALAYYKLACKLEKLFNRSPMRSTIEAAERACRKALHLAPDWGRPQHELGLILALAGRHIEAEAQFEAAASLNEGWFLFHFAQGENKKWAGDYDAAIAKYDLALRLRPNFEHAKMFKGACLMALGKKREANKLLKTLQHIDPSFADDDGWRRLLKPPPMIDQ